MTQTNIVPDIVDCELPLDNRRSPGYRRIEPHMTDNNFYLWIGQHETGRYSKGHAHGSAAVLICIKGKGYTYTWPAIHGETPWKDGKEEFAWTRRVQSIEHARFALRAWLRAYNTQRPHQALNFKTPNQHHQAQCKAA